jgi:hypothetical protein
VAFDVALTDGDELALAIERGRQLQSELANAVAALAELDAALQSERRRHVATQRKLEAFVANGCVVAPDPRPVPKPARPASQPQPTPRARSEGPALQLFDPAD